MAFLKKLAKILLVVYFVIPPIYFTSLGVAYLLYKLHIPSYSVLFDDFYSEFNQLGVSYSIGGIVLIFTGLIGHLVRVFSKEKLSYFMNIFIIAGVYGLFAWLLYLVINSFFGTQ